jgi:hypothetical protein
MFGEALQITTIFIGLTTTWLFSTKRTARYGYLLGLTTIPVWIILQIYYRQWCYLFVNPFYIYLWAKGLKNHWKR